MTDLPARLRTLVDQINQANHQYYVLDQPTITDSEWDRLYDELISLEASSGIILPDSPSLRVGAEPLSAFRPHRHLRPLYSLDKVNSLDGLQLWFERVRSLHEKAGDLPPLQYAVEYKYDGLTINLTYQDGQLMQAATRGNGQVGEEVLPQARTIKGIPLAIPFKGLVEVQGECIMRLSVLSRYNRAAKEGEQLKNARNAAAGALRNLDPRETAKRRLDARFYEAGHIEEAPFLDQAGLNGFLLQNGFPTSPLLYLGSQEEGILQAINQAEQQREQLDFLIDGLVIKVVDFATRDRLGYTDKFPRWALAYKFQAEEATATLEAVVWDVGRSGKLTPTGHISPVDFAGVTVRRATLNNHGDIMRKRLSLGATVFVRRSGDVIPEILGRVEDAIEGQVIQKPVHCPACGSLLVETGAHLFCLNAQHCPPQVIARLTHFCSRDAMDIASLSEKTLELLFDRLDIREASQLYALGTEQLLGLPGFQIKKAQNLVEAIQASKQCQLDAFIYALGIPGIGRVGARDLANAFGSLDALKAASREQILQVNAFGEVMASAVLEYLADPARQIELNALLASGVNPVHQGAAPKAGASLQGKVFVLTGRLPSLTRQQAEDIITQHGGVIASGVSKKTNYLLLGEDAGSKANKARDLGIPTISEDELMDMIKPF